VSSGTLPSAASLSGRQIRQLDASDGLEAELALRVRAFGPITAAQRASWIAALEPAVADTRLFGVFDGSEMIASARFHDMRQWWHGRQLPMAGVAGVKVAPEYRGQGIGKVLMTALLEEIARRGYPVSALYPATASIYRSLGWELAGGQWEAVLPARSLGALLPPDVSAQASAVTLRRATAADAAEVVETIGAVHAALRDSGPATRDVPTYRAWLADPDEFAYLADDGFVSYRWADGHHQILVNSAVAGSEQTARAIWGIIASHASIARTVRAHVGPSDPLSWLTREPDVEVSQRHRWMLRLVDVPAAIAARGFPAAAGLTAVLRLEDRTRPANSGRWRLEVGGGQGSLTPAETAERGAPDPAAPVTLGARGLAALYAGIPMPALRRSGLAAGGDPDTDAALDCVFAAGAFMPDYF
jgi:predicted acetyltransferase